MTDALQQREPSFRRTIAAVAYAMVVATNAPWITLLAVFPRRQKAEAALEGEKRIKIFSSSEFVFLYWFSLPFWRLFVPVRAISGAAAHLVFLPKSRIECPLELFLQNVKASALTTTLTLALELASNR